MYATQRNTNTMVVYGGVATLQHFAQQVVIITIIATTL